MSWQIASVLIAFVGLLVTLLIEWPKLSVRFCLVIERFVSTFSCAQLWRPLLSRRTFLISIAAGGALVVGGLALTRFQNRNTGLRWLSYLIARQEAPMVINFRSGVIHHTVFCATHLPLPKNRRLSTTLKREDHFHKSLKVKILETIAAQRPDEDAVQLLLLALEGNTTTIHVYDRLIRLLGKLKRYESIHFLLENARKTLIASRDSSLPGTKAFCRYAKAVRDIELRQEQARMRARAATVRL
jgi:hypothetical protein